MKKIASERLIITIPNGVYDLVLRVRGGTDETNAIVRVRIESNLKIGQFSFSEQDLVIPVSGIPLTVTRTYDSLRTERRLAAGFHRTSHANHSTSSANEK
jgi:hypothetical protein